MQLPPRLPEPSLLQWLASNPTGIPRRTALLRAAVGTALAVPLSLLLACRVRPAESPGERVAEIAGAALLGGALAPLCVTAATYTLDRAFIRRDALLGYSGVMRELLHAGELAFLGALGAGLARSAGSTQAPGSGLLVGSLVTGLVGGILYTLRGFGPGLGLGVGLLSGLVGALLGRVARRRT